MRDGASSGDLPPDTFAAWEIAAVRREVHRFLGGHNVPNWEAGDLEQECLTHWWVKRRGYRATGGSNPRTFLRPVVNALLVDLLRAETAQKRGSGTRAQSLDAPLATDDGEGLTWHEVVGDPAPVERPELVLHQRLLADVVVQAQARLGASDRQLLDAWLEGHNATEMGVLLGQPRTTITSRLHKLFERLRSDELGGFL